MKIAIIDADLVGIKKHRFPNLACMKISGYYKEQGENVELKTDYENLQEYDKVFISKVFSTTKVDDAILHLPNVQYGGTGFFYDKASKLPDEIEHHMPDYHLYDNWLKTKLNGKNRKEFSYYLDYSIGFMTRGCIRRCSFCVNKHYKTCELHSPIYEFLDNDRPYICLLDDNVLACREWKKVFNDLIATGKRFQFKQGCDERLLTGEKCDVLFNKSKWIGERIFAFDNIKDKEIIEKKLQLIRQYTSAQIKFYTFCGFDHSEKSVYDEEFWVNDIKDLFERIRILAQYKCIPYVMRHENYKKSPYKGMYNSVAGWCNQPAFLKKMSFREFCEYNNKLNRRSLLRYLNEFELKHPEIATEYFDMKWDDFQ